MWHLQSLNTAKTLHYITKVAADFAGAQKLCRNRSLHAEWIARHTASSLQGPQHIGQGSKRDPTMTLQRPTGRPSRQPAARNGRNLKPGILQLLVWNLPKHLNPIPCRQGLNSGNKTQQQQMIFKLCMRTKVHSGDLNLQKNKP